MIDTISRITKALQRAQDSLVAFKMMPGPHNRWELHDELNLEAVEDALLAIKEFTLPDLIEGMSVSVDVSTGDDDSGNRYFGTVTEVMDNPGDKHGVTLLVQDAEPNFTPPKHR